MPTKSNLNFAKFFAILLGNTYVENHPVEFVPFGPEKKSFVEDYNKYILPQVNYFEGQRIEAVSSMRIRALVLISVTLVLEIFFILKINFDNYEWMIKWTVYSLMIFIGIFYIWAYKPIKDYKVSVKKTIFPHLFKFFGNFEYNVTSKFPLDEVKDFDVLPRYNGSKLESSVNGEYKNVRMYITDALLMKDYYTTSGRKEVLVFSGVLFLFSMNKSFEGKTILTTSGTIAQTIRNFGDGLEGVELEDPIFNDRFDVYSSDQIRARHLLSPGFMIRLLRLSELFDNSDISCGFYNKSFFMALSLNDYYFEINSIFTKVDFIDDINTVIEEMNLILEIIDLLRLDGS